MPPRKAGSYTSPNATQFLFSFMSPVCNTGCVLWIIINKTTDIFLFNRTFLFPCNPWTFSLLCLLELNVTFTSRTTENLLSQTWQISCRAAKDVGCRAQVHLNELCLLSFIQIPFFKKKSQIHVYLSLSPHQFVHSWICHYCIHFSSCTWPRVSISSTNKPSVPLCYLQDFSSDVLLAALTLDAKHGVVVHLAEGDSIPDRTTQDKSADLRQRGAEDTLHITRETAQSLWILRVQHVWADSAQQAIKEGAGWSSRCRHPTEVIKL